MMTPRPWLSFVVACLLLGALALSRTAAAHPAGMSSINRYLGVEWEGLGGIHIVYWLDFAELPAYAELEDLDANHDDKVSPEEQEQYLTRRLTPIVRTWTVAVDDERATAHIVARRLEIYPGERGLSTLRIAADIEVEPSVPIDPSATDVQVFVRDLNFADRPGWRELAANDSPQAFVVSGPKERPDDALAYGRPQQAVPPRVDHADFSFRRSRGVTPRENAPGPRGMVDVDARLVRLGSLLRDKSGSQEFFVVAIGLTALLGAAHALTPGHGKALAAATLVGSRAHPSSALIFGMSVAASHTAVVLLLGGFAIAIERTLGSDRLMRGVELASAAAVAVIGFVQLTSRWKALASPSVGDHFHAADAQGGTERGRLPLAAVGAFSGLAACPTALGVWLSAVALHRVALGLLLVVAFSAGVATTLTLVGLVVVLARRVAERAAPLPHILRWLPVVSSACVTAIGILLCASAWSARGGR